MIDSLTADLEHVPPAAVWVDAPGFTVLVARHDGTPCAGCLLVEREGQLPEVHLAIPPAFRGMVGIAAAGAFKRWWIANRAGRNVWTWIEADCLPRVRKFIRRLGFIPAFNDKDGHEWLFCPLKTR